MGAAETLRKIAGAIRGTRVDLQAPAVDATGHALARIDTLFAQPMNDVQAADAVMAKHDERCFIGQCVQPRELGRHGSHGNQLGVGDARELEFVGLADVDQREFFAGWRRRWTSCGVISSASQSDSRSNKRDPFVRLHHRSGGWMGSNVI